MSTDVLPTMPGLTFPQGRSMIWSDDLQEAVSGKETAIARWTYPRWEWSLSYSVIRTFTVTSELKTFLSFALKRQGRPGTFLYQDQDDNTAVGQIIGTGDGATRTFQLVRAFGGVGGFVEPIWAPQTVSAVYVNGAAVTGWSVQHWEETAPGLITLASAPAAGAVVTADFTYYFPVRFTESRLDLQKFLMGRYKAEKLTFHSIK